MALWHALVGDSDNEEEFEGFTEADLVKMEDGGEGESDLEIDWDEVERNFDSDGDSSGDSSS